MKTRTQDMTCRALAALLAVALIGGCEMFKKKVKTEDGEVITEPKWVMTFNEVVRYPRADKLEKEVPAFDGRSVWVQRHYPLCSKNIQDIELLPIADKPGFYDLRLTVDQRGSRACAILADTITAAPLAVLIDGMYYRIVKIERPTGENEELVVARGPFEKVIAENLKKYGAANYKLYHWDAKADDEEDDE